MSKHFKEITHARKTLSEIYVIN